MRLLVVLIQIFLGDIVLRNFVCPHWSAIGVRSVFHTTDCLGLEALALFQKFIHTFRIRFLHVR